MSTAAVSGAEAVKGPSAGNMGGSKQSTKGSAGGKALDGARKQAASPVDGQNRKQSSQPPKAWQGPNPITSRANTASIPNGTEKPLPRLPPQAQQKMNGESHSDKHAHDRLLYILANCTGMDATLTLKNGEQFTGVFSGANLDTPAKAQYVLKMVKRTSLPIHQQVNGTIDMADEYTGEGEDHVMTFEVQDTIDLTVKDVTTAAAQPSQNGSIASSFRTDTEISSREARMPRERELQRWEEPELNQSLEDMSLEAGGATGWDQFAANESKYGVQSSYDEEYYTTSIDRSHPEYKRREAQAARLAREIEGSTPANAHIAEERRRDADRGDGMDEEDKYSGVRREAPALPKGAAGSYVPPSRRPITGQPTVPGAPYDPAIISTARPTPPPAAQPITAPEVIEPAKTPEPSAKANEQRLPTDATPKTEATSSMQASPAVRNSEKTTDDRVRDTADAFKQFANNEKLRIRQAQEQKRVTARHEKNVRLNDLKKFAENFKLKSRVPDDLVPILAKDREKQVEIQKKAEETAKEEELRAKEKEKEKASPAPSSVASVTASAVDSRNLPFTQHSRGVSRNMRVPAAIPPGPSPRAPQSQRQQPRGGIEPLPANLRIPTGPAAPAPGLSGPLSPTSATRLNVNAFEFRPAASTFTPSGTSPSPQRTVEGMKVEAAAAREVSFFDKEKDSSKPRKSEQDFENSFNTIKRLKNADRPEDQKKQFAANGGIPQPFRTAPTWLVPDDRLNVSYLDAFPKSRAPSSGTSPLHTPNPNGLMPHAHQLPAHLQAPQITTPTQTPRFYPPPQHAHAQSFAHPNMTQFGPNGSVQNSPRFPPAQMAFNNQMPQMPPMPQFAGQPMQGYGMSPSMQYRQMNMPPGGQMMMMPGQPHGQMTPMRQGFPQNAQFPPGMPQMGGQMMVQQPSGGYMNGPMPQQPYSPMPPHAQPHLQHMQQQGPAGYSGSPRPHMMQHQGSHQGYQPQMHMAPPYGPGNTGQPHPYHMQQRQMSHGQYPQMTPRQQSAVPQHVPSPGMGGGVAAQGDEGRPLSTQEETARLAAKEKYKPMATYHHHYGKVMWHPPEDLKMVLLDHGNIESPGGTVTWWLEGYGPNEQRRSSKERAPSNANSARADSPVARPSTEGL